MTKEQDLKICDFGLAQECSPKTYFPKGSPRRGKTLYMAPEIFAHYPYHGQQADIWSIGVILFLMLTGAPPWEIPAMSDKRFQLVYEGRIAEIGRAVQQECRDRSRMPSSA
eukprot:TRINITY_DN48768_c0_g1_i4.p1 TRINITY_DN48768_c0_g1~~TRINITY_DN48768_c0_g1_i4.p1  ORF type:complete len:111 (-),score=7.42 TRINITY_DN48768_c0_g1_i4:10-342(-)